MSYYCPCADDSKAEKLYEILQSSSSANQNFLVFTACEKVIWI